MPLDLRGFMAEPDQWTGLYHAADQLEKRRLRADQLAAQREGRRAAAGTFLQNYLDPKDFLTGTNYDPMIVKGIEEAKMQGAQLAAAGADSPTLMMALGPMVNKLNLYSTNAKNINKRVDEQIKQMRESGLTGYNYGALKEEAMRHAFYKSGPNGQTMIDPGDIDPSADYITKAIEASPDKVTTAAGLDLFAKNSPMSKTLSDRQKWTGMGEMDRSKVHLIGQNWLIPERDQTGRITDLVPKYDLATTEGKPLLHNFTDEFGNVKPAQVRYLSEDIFDDMMQRRPDTADYIKGILKQHIKEYTDSTGKQISMNDPRAKLVARAIAYDELYKRRTSNIEQADVIDKPSSAQIRLNVGSSPEWQKMLEGEAKARATGRQSVLGSGGKANAVEVMIRALKDDSDILQGDTIEKDGRQVYDITSMFPGGGLSAGRGADFKYKGIFFDPGSREFVVEKEQSDRFGIKKKHTESIPESDISTFLHKIAQANGIGVDQVKKIMEKLGYGKAGDLSPAQDVDNRLKNNPSWRDAYNQSVTNPFGQQFIPKQ